jgi:hypothetical protein
MIRNVFVFVTVVATVSLAAFAGTPFGLHWYSIDGGGVMRGATEDGSLALSGTIGQPDAGTMTGGKFKLTGGFWFELPPGDCNATGSVGLPDHEGFVTCMLGPDDVIEVACQCFDVNSNGTVDLVDFSTYQRSFRGE